jgi:ectoine hydroxylase-related dioxygenase (phytanoyl-CoA dioxygenase family)
MKKLFAENGFCVLKKLCSHEIIENIVKSIHTGIEYCAAELNCSQGDYLRNVSRWLHPSPVTENVYSIVKILEKNISDFIGAKVSLKKINVICKSVNANQPIPCHQDIAYSNENPYEFSLWLSLQDVKLEDGALEFLVGSHLKTIEPAIDFWQPNFEDKMYLSYDWQQNNIAVPVQAGDAIIFDSRIWHRSAQNSSGNNRFALVTRWSRVDYQPPEDIPERVPAAFGMWTSGKITQLLLKQGLKSCFDINISSDLITYIQLWQEKLDSPIKLPFMVDVPNVKRALNDVSILHRAAELHHGGDAQGTVYANLWQHFLLPLSLWLSQ